MSLDVELHFKKPLFGKGIRLTMNDFLLKEAGYGIPDSGNRLEEGKCEEGFFIVYHKEYPGRGFNVEHEPDFSYAALSLNIPCTSADLHLFFATVGNILLTRKNYTATIDGQPLNKNNLRGYWEGHMEYNRKYVEHLHENLGGNETTVLFGIYHPMTLGEKEMTQIRDQESFDSWVYENQKTDAFFTACTVYADPDGVVEGRYFVFKDLVCIVPKKPYLPFGMRLKDGYTKDDVRRFVVCVGDSEGKKIINEYEYEDFLRTYSDRLIYYDANHYLIQSV